MNEVGQGHGKLLGLLGANLEDNLVGERAREGVAMDDSNFIGCEGCRNWQKFNIFTTFGLNYPMAPPIAWPPAD